MSNCYTVSHTLLIYLQNWENVTRNAKGKQRTLLGMISLKDQWLISLLILHPSNLQNYFGVKEYRWHRFTMKTLANYTLHQLINAIITLLSKNGKTVLDKSV